MPGNPWKRQRVVVWGLLILQLVMRRRMTCSFLERVHMRGTQVGWGSIFHSARWMNPSSFIRGFIIWLRNRWSHFFKADCYLVFTVWEIVPVPCMMSLKQTYSDLFRWLNIIGPMPQTLKNIFRDDIYLPTYSISRMNHSNSTRAHNLGVSMNTSTHFQKVSFYSSFWNPRKLARWVLLSLPPTRWDPMKKSSILGCELPSNSGKWRFRLGSPTKRYHALARLPHKAHLRISPNEPLELRWIFSLPLQCWKHGISFFLARGIIVCSGDCHLLDRAAFRTFWATD